MHTSALKQRIRCGPFAARLLLVPWSIVFRSTYGQY